MESTGWEVEGVDRLCTERHPGVWHSAGGWKATTLEAKMWVETVREGGQRIMAA